MGFNRSYPFGIWYDLQHSNGCFTKPDHECYAE